MLSVIIPTMFKEERIYLTLEELSKEDCVGEIIVIDNSGESRNHPIINKVKWHKEFTNIYVNPSWNLGAKLSTFDHLCFLNDDIWFEWKVLNYIDKAISIDKGMIGMSSKNYLPLAEDFNITEIYSERNPKGARPIGYGCCFFIHKKNWIEIPNDIKIWAGDDFIFYYKNNLKNWLIQGIEIHGNLSKTVEDENLSIAFKPIMHNDMLLVKQQIKAGNVYNFLENTIWETYGN